MSLMDNFKELEAKQKVMLVFIVILVGVAIYMGYTTFFPAAPTVNPTTSVPVPPPTLTPASMQRVLPPTPSSPTVTQQPSSNQSVPKAAAPTPEQLALLAQSQQLQTEYVHLVNQYQIAQLEQKLAATNADIAKAKLSTTKTYLETQKLEGNSSFKTITADGTPKVTSEIQVKYVGYYQGVWTAMVGSGDDYFEVKEGSRLPDGSTVVSISSQGVVLDSGGQRKYLAIPKTLD